MSTAYFPQGTESYNNTETGKYISWKGRGIYSNPAAVTSGNIRPLTNNDITNFSQTGFGLPRPLKHYRKGTTVNVPIKIDDSNQPGEYLYINTNRQVRSSTKSNLVGQLIDKPGEFSVKENKLNQMDEIEKLNQDCQTCNAIGLVTDYYPSTYLTNNPQSVTTNPMNCCNEQKKALKRVRPASTLLKKNYFTTHEQYFQNRCQTYDQKIFNFYKGPLNETIQNAYFNNNPLISPSKIKPGSPIALQLENTYIANCYPTSGSTGYTEIELVAQSFEYVNNAGALAQNDVQSFYNQSIHTLSDFIRFLSTLSDQSNQALAISIFQHFITNPYVVSQFSGPSNAIGCKTVIYKPSNYQFATQGGVTSSTRTLKLGLTTIEKNVALQKKFNQYQNNSVDTNINAQGVGQSFVPFLYKNKAPKCSPGLGFYWKQNGNPKTCSMDTNDYSSTF